MYGGTEKTREHVWKFSKEEREEIITSDPNPVGRRINQLILDYAEKFNEIIGIPVGMNQDIEDWIADVQRCIDAGTPYVYPESNLPDDCLI